MAVFDATTGLPVALLLDNGFLTDIRTGAAGAIAAEVLAPRAIRHASASSAPACRRAIRSPACAWSATFSRIVAWSPDRAHLDRYVAEMQAEGYEAAAAATPEAVCRAADVLVTATPARQPLVRAEWLRPGQHVTALGSDSPGKQELDAACLARADLVVVDRLTQCAAFGELRHATRRRAPPPGSRPRRARRDRRGLASRDGPSDAQITIADLTGVGFQDTAIAAKPSTG